MTLSSRFFSLSSLVSTVLITACGQDVSTAIATSGRSAMALETATDKTTPDACEPYIIVDGEKQCLQANLTYFDCCDANGENCAGIPVADLPKVIDSCATLYYCAPAIGYDNQGNPVVDIACNQVKSVLDSDKDLVSKDSAVPASFITVDPARLCCALNRDGHYTCEDLAEWERFVDATGAMSVVAACHEGLRALNCEGVIIQQRDGTYACQGDTQTTGLLLPAVQGGGDKISPTTGGGSSYPNDGCYLICEDDANGNIQCHCEGT